MIQVTAISNRIRIYYKTVKVMASAHGGALTGREREKKEQEINKR
jgi:hypothetical protein